MIPPMVPESFNESLRGYSRYTDMKEKKDMRKPYSTAYFFIRVARGIVEIIIKYESLSVKAKIRESMRDRATEMYTTVLWFIGHSHLHRKSLHGIILMIQPFL